MKPDTDWVPGDNEEDVYEWDGPDEMIYSYGTKEDESVNPLNENERNVQITV